MSPAQGARDASLEAQRHAFKHAQGKFSERAAHLLPTHERERVRCDAVAYIREWCFRDGATHYQLLNVPTNAKRDAIKENYHLLMALVHPDRAEGAREAWPAHWAQRANHAYAVLSDASARAAYDMSLAAPDLFPPRQHREIRRRPGRGAAVVARRVKAVLVLAGVAAMVMLVDASIDSPAQFPFVGSSRGVDIAASTERPRFLGATVTPAREWTPDPLPVAAKPRADRDLLLAPLWRDPLPSPAITAPQAEPPGFVREASVVAQAPAVMPVPVPVAQAPASEARLSGTQIEIVVARLIAYYEAGETDNLMALFDPRDAGQWQTVRMRQAYADFFRATRQRRLRVKSLAWRDDSASAHALGQATVQAEYVDAPGSLERDVPVEMEIALRNGQAKITRLSLFPNAP
jgi:hypothetical protein